MPEPLILNDIPGDASRERTIYAINEARRALTDSARTQAEKQAVLEKAVADLGEKLQEERRANAERALAAQTAAPATANSVALAGFLRSVPDGGQRSNRPEEAIRLFAPEQARGANGRPINPVPGLLDSEPVDEWHARLQQLVSQRSLVRTLSAANKNRGAPSPISDALISDHLRTCPHPEMRRIFADNSGYGAEWIPDNWSSELFAYLRSARRVSALFQELSMPGKVLIIPFLATGLRPRLRGTPGTNTPGVYPASNLATLGPSFAAVSQVVRTLLDEDAAEDSIINAQATLNQALGEALADGEEDAIINGDTAATHQDAIASWDPRSRWGSSGLGASDDHRRAWIGLRARSFDVSSTLDASAAQTWADAVKMRGRLKVGGSPGDMAYITSPEHFYAKMLNWDEVKTVYAFGPAATNQTGQIGQIAGVPLVLSDFMTADLHTTGLYTGASSTTALILVNAARFRMARRRGVMLEAEKSAGTGVWDLVASKRDLFLTFDASTDKNVAYNFNLSAS